MTDKGLNIQLHSGSSYRDSPISPSPCQRTTSSSGETAGSDDTRTEATFG